jgi:hypothetical protein
MGARYASAADLSSVVGNELRTPQFLPFIRYRLQFVGSNLMLSAGRPDESGETGLSLALPERTIAEDFSFEDPGDGFVLIRSHAGRLYLTARQSAVVLENRYGSGGGEGHADPQRWKVSALGDTDATRDVFVISNQALPGSNLQPVTAGRVGSAVSLAMAPAGAPVDAAAWRISSPLLDR